MAAIAVLLAVVGVVAGARTAWADDSEYSITVSNSNQRVSINGKIYSAYKVFDLTLGGPTTSGSGTTYGAYSYTISPDSWAWETLVKGVTKAADGSYTTSYGLKLVPTGTGSTTYSVDQNTMTDTNARSLADALTSVITMGGRNADGSATAANETATITLASAGYYAVYGTATTTDGSKSLVAALSLTTTDKTPTIQPKVDAPTLEKKITGVKDGQTTKTGAVLSGDKAATAAVGDTVSFELTSAVPDTTGYTSYTYEVTDKLSSGLDFVTSSGNPIVNVNIDSKPLTDGFTARLDSNDSSYRTLKVTIPIDTLKNYNVGSTITISYAATVNEEAATKSYDSNTASLTFSNNPSQSTSTDTTPDKKTYVVNVNLNVNKVAGNEGGSKLAGAKFKLYKGSDSSQENVWYQYDSTTKKVTWGKQKDATEFTTNTQGSFDTPIYGLGNGNYSLVETEAPSGYNKIDSPTTVTISADYGSGDNASNVVVTANGATVTNGVIDINSNAQENSALATATVINKTGAQLPSTGGAGTVAFYVVGGVLIVGAVAYLVHRRKANA